MFGPGAALLAGLLLFAGTAAAAEWERVSDKDGLLVERRAVAGSPFPEFRATARSPLPPAAIFDTLWKHEEYFAFVPHLKRLELLSDTGDERVTYEQVAVPLARDRDYTVRARKRVDQAAQRYEITFTSANEAGPPPDGRYVRVSSIRGGWIVEPGIDGQGSIVRYDGRPSRVARFPPGLPIAPSEGRSPTSSARCSRARSRRTDTSER
jgi:hypothetical protein